MFEFCLQISYTCTASTRVSFTSCHCSDVQRPMILLALQYLPIPSCRINFAFSETYSPVTIPTSQENVRILGILHKQCHSYSTCFALYSRVSIPTAQEEEISCRMYATAAARSDGLLLLCGGRDAEATPLGDAYGLARHRDGRWEWAEAPGNLPLWYRKPNKLVYLKLSLDNEVSNYRQNVSPVTRLGSSS